MTERVCINSDYQASKAPEEFTKVYHTITHAKVVKIKELENRIEFDIKMNQFLDDSRVRANLIPRDKYHGGIRLPWNRASENDIQFLWTPENKDFVCPQNDNDAVIHKRHQKPLGNY